jgi:hypothetical protein
LLAPCTRHTFSLSTAYSCLDASSHGIEKKYSEAHLLEKILDLSEKIKKQIAATFAELKAAIADSTPTGVFCNYSLLSFVYAWFGLL